MVSGTALANTRQQLILASVVASLGCTASADNLDGGVGVGLDAGSRDSGRTIDAGLPGPGPLMGLPSPEGPHIATIRALGDDAWQQLPNPAGDPSFGIAPGRSWGGKAFAWAPDLRGAFLYGEGPHGYIWRDGYANDELWVYDANGNRWITVHPGTDTRTFSARVRSGELRLNDNLQLVDSTDQPLPVHVLIHAWSYVAYDADRQALTFFASRGLGTYYLAGWDNGAGPMAEGISLLEAQATGRTEPVMAPWTYEVTAGRFARPPASGTRSHSGTGFPQFLYVSTMRKFFLGGREGVSYFDAATRTWSDANDRGPRPVGYDHGGCYDPTRNRIYLGGGSDETTPGLFTYDLATDTWTAPAAGGPTGFGTNDATVNYDSASDTVTVISLSRRTVFVYNIASRSWSLRPFPTQVTYPSHSNMMGFYNPELNAYFLYFAPDGIQDGVMWVYRYRQAP